MVEFANTLEPSGTTCFIENIGESVQAIVDVNSPSDKLILTIIDPKGKKIHTSHNQAEMRHNFAAFDGGNHQICVQSLNKREEVRYRFKIETGVQATDYSNIVTKKHLRPVELQAQKIQDMIEQLRSELTTLVISEEGLKAQNEKIKSRVVIFGIISIIVMLVSTYLQVTYLKSFFRNKKII